MQTATIHNTPQTMICDKCANVIWLETVSYEAKYGTIEFEIEAGHDADCIGGKAV